MIAYLKDLFSEKATVSITRYVSTLFAIVAVWIALKCVYNNNDKFNNIILGFITASATLKGVSKFAERWNPVNTTPVIGDTSE